MSGQHDVAFSLRLWAYRVGRPHRKERRIIRIRPGPDVLKQSRILVELAEQDQTDAGESWSDKELDIVHAPIDELVLIVGELLPVEDTLGRPWHLPRVIAHFDETFHTIVPRSTRAKVVCMKLSNTRGNMFLLHDKKDGLCRILQVPQNLMDYTVFYREWTVGSFATTQKERYAEWNRKMSRFITRFIEKRQSKFPGGPHGRLDAVKCVENLMNGEDNISLEEAEEAALACKKLWFENTPRNQAGSAIIRASHLVLLARGLRAKALGDASPEEPLYRGLVLQFCSYMEYNAWEHDDPYAPAPCSEKLKDLLRNVYHTIAAPTLGDAHSPEAPSTQEDDEKSTSEAVENAKLTIEASILSIDEYLEGNRRRPKTGRVLGGLLNLGTPNPHPLFEGIANVMEDALERLWQEQYGLLCGSVDGLRNRLRENLEYLEGIADFGDGDVDAMKMAYAGNGVDSGEDEDEDEDGSEDEDENAMDVDSPKIIRRRSPRKFPVWDAKRIDDMFRYR